MIARVFAVFLCLALSACFEYAPPAELAARNKTLLLGNAADPSNLDPNLVTGLSEYRILSALFEGLTSANQNTLEVEPAAAESWTFKDGVYTFKIRQNAKWSDGEPLKASDFVFSFRRSLNPAVSSEYANFLYPIKNAEKIHKGELPQEELGAVAIDEKTLKIELERPCAHFLNLLYHCSFFPLPEHVLRKANCANVRDGSWMKENTAVTNGPFKLSKWRINDKVLVEKNPFYWDSESIKLNSIEFLPISNINTEDRAFMAKQLHISDSIAPTRIESIKKETPESLSISDFLGVYYYALNVSRPPLDDVRVREALSLAISRQAIIDNFLRAGQKPALSFVPEKSQAGYECKFKLSEDLKRARELLAQAGYPNGRGFPKITITYNTSEQHRPIAEAIQAMWKSGLNIDVKLYNLSWPAYLDARKVGDFFITRASWTADYASPESFLTIFKSDSALNHSRYKNKKFDEALDFASRASSENSAQAFAKAEEILLRDFAVIPIYFYSRVFLIKPYVKNWGSNPLDYHNYKDVDFDLERLEK